MTPELFDLAGVPAALRWIYDAEPGREPFCPGVFEGYAAELYHDVEAMSNGGSSKILKTPSHYRLMRTKKNKPTPTMQFGTAVHDGTLEPATFKQRVAIAPDVDKRTKAGKSEWAAFEFENVGKTILTPEAYARALRCIAAVWEHPYARGLIEGATIETSLFWIDGKYKVPCKARLDIRSHGGITDLKTTADASPEEFAKSIANYSYTVQGAHYFSGHEHILNSTPEFFALIAVESEEPHGVAVYDMPSNGIVYGAARMDEALRRYRDAIAARKWAGYPEKIQTIALPKWATTIPASAYYPTEEK